jgi:hypothetical protein
VAQKFRNTTLPCHSAVETTPPLISRTRKGGTACGLLANRMTLICDPTAQWKYFSTEVTTRAGSRCARAVWNSVTRRGRDGIVPRQCLLRYPQAQQLTAKMKIKYLVHCKLRVRCSIMPHACAAEQRLAKTNRKGIVGFALAERAAPRRFGTVVPELVPNLA